MEYDGQSEEHQQVIAATKGSRRMGQGWEIPERPASPQYGSACTSFGPLDSHMPRPTTKHDLLAQSHEQYSALNAMIDGYSAADQLREFKPGTTNCNSGVGSPNRAN